MKKTIFILLFVTNYLFAQKETLIFGYGGGIEFSKEGIKELKGVQLSSPEACACVSDENGNLLYYSDGNTIFNAQHKAIPNGQKLIAHKSAAQGVLMLPVADYKSIYVFTLDEKGGNGGFSYSIIERHNTGEFMLMKNKFILKNTAEMMGVTEASDGGYWILVQQISSNKIFSLHLTDTGIEDMVPNESKIKISDENKDGKLNEAIGTMSFNSNGSLLMVNYANLNGNKSIVYSFDAKTGKLSNPIEISNHRGAYASAFSKDNKNIFFSFDKGDTLLTCYNLLTKKNKVVNIENGKNGGAIRYISDKEILIAKTGSTLDLIEFNEGEYVFKKDFIRINDGNCAYGLPIQIPPYKKIIIKNTIPEVTGITKQSIPKQDNLVNSIESTSTTSKIDCSALKLKATNDTSLCADFIKVAPVTNATKLEWSTGETNKEINISKEGTYWLKAFHGTCMKADTFNVNLIHTKPKLSYVREFNPKANSFNSLFSVSVRYGTLVKLEVFDKKGVTVFSTLSETVRWDGRVKEKIAKGNYTFKAEMKSLCSGKISFEEGSVKVIDE